MKTIYTIALLSLVGCGSGGDTTPVTSPTVTPVPTPEVTPVPTPTPEVTPVPTPTPTQDEIYLEAINKLRTTEQFCGLSVMPAVGAVTWSNELKNAAYEHSYDMVINNYFDHTGSGEAEDLTAIAYDNNGSIFSQRIYYNNYLGFARSENIAYGYETVEAVLEGWMNSIGHCRNIMDEKSTEVGLAQENNYWTQVFGI